MNEDMEKMLQEAPAPTLTLEPFAEEKEEPAVVEKEEAVQPVDEKEKIKAILTPQEQKQVDAFVKQIDITNSQMVLQYGASSQKKIADFSESALGNVRTKDLGEIGNELTAVVNELKSIEDGDEEKGFLGLFKKGGNKIANMKAKYAKAEVNVDKICKVLEGHQIQLLKDAAMLDQMYQLNLTYYKELSMYILAGKEKIQQVKEQELPDGTFPTIEYPNPEDTRAFEYSIKLGKEKDADLLIATDPDCDRVAIMVKHDGKYEEINGNQAGVILIHYILSQMNEKNLIKPDSIIVKSIVTAEMGTLIAKKYGVEMVDVLTGFKNIFAVQNELDRTKAKTMIMGYEESIGYAVGTFVRDKDAVTSSMMFAEAAAFYRAQGKTLIDVLNELYEEFGYHREDTVSIVMEGITGQQQIAKMMEQYRTAYPREIADMKLARYIDYRTQEELDIATGTVSKVNIEKQNAIKFQFECGSWYALRPSGTEPKIKIYACTRAETNEKSVQKLADLKETVLAELKKI